MYEIKRSDKEIDDVLNMAGEAVDAGRSEWQGMSYEQGVQAGIDWITGATDDNPMVDE